MHKFTFQRFRNSHGEFAINSHKYTKEMAIEIFERETGMHIGDNMEGYSVSNAWAYWKTGINKDLQPYAGWQLEYKERNGSIPVWEFHLSMYDWKCEVCGCT